MMFAQPTRSRLKGCASPNNGVPHGEAYALSRRAVALIDHAMDAGGGRRTLRHPPLELEQGRHPRSRLSRGEPDGQGARAQARRRRHHRDGGDLRLPRRRISARQAQRAGRHIASGRLSQMAVLRSELHRGGDDGSRQPAQGRAAARHAGLRRFRHRDGCDGESGREGPLSHGRAVHCRRRGRRLDAALGHDVFKLVPERPEFTAYTNRLAARPALQRAEAKDKELAAA